MSGPDDLKAIMRAVELCRDLGNSRALQPFVKREVVPGALKGNTLESFIRDSVTTIWHQSCTARTGRGPMSVVDSEFRVHGIGGLRIADASILPRVTTGNTMAPCVVIGERAADMINNSHKL